VARPEILNCGVEPPKDAPEAKWFGGRAPSTGRFLQFLNKNNAFYAYSCQTSYFKSITGQVKAFEKQSERTK